MSVDASNILRVELQDIYDAIERETAHRSEAHDNGDTIDILAIVEDDRDDVLPFIMLACAEIADKSNYVQNENQNGLDALTRTDNGIYEGQDLEYVPEKEKLIGESLDPKFRDQLIFSVTELENISPNKYTIVQEYIKESIIRFTLHKWYHMKSQFEYSKSEYNLYLISLKNVRFNSITNKKRKSVKLPYRYF